MKIRLVAAAFVSLGASFATAGAVSLPATLDQLVAAGDQGVTVGDKQFFDFSVLGDTPASQIHVIQAPGSVIGLEFQADWNSTDGKVVDTLIRYQVHVTDPTQVITGVGLHFDGAAVGNGSDLLVNASTTETITNPLSSDTQQIGVFNGGPAFASLNHNDAVFTLPAPGVRDLLLAKDITAHSAVELPGEATLSLVDNTFMESPSGTPHTTAVPLPPAAWMGLSTMGLGALATLRRRIGTALHHR